MRTRAIILTIITAALELPWLLTIDRGSILFGLSLGSVGTIAASLRWWVARRRFSELVPRWHSAMAWGVAMQALTYPLVYAAVIIIWAAIGGDA
jgi:hypothetical protein